MRNLASGIAFMAAFNIACVTSAQSPVVSAGTSAKPGPEKGRAYWKDRIRRLLAVIDRDEQAVRDVEEEAHRVGARLASPRYRVRTGLH